MRVLHAIPSLGGGGAERQLSLLAPALTKLGVDAHVVYQYDGEHRAALEDGGVSLHPLGLPGYRDARLPYRLHRIVRRVEPDVLHTWLPVMDVVGGAIALASRVPWLLSERSVAAAYAARSLTLRARSILARQAAGVVANSADGLAQWNGVFAAERRFLVPNALALDAIARASTLPRTELPLDPTAPLVVYAGRFAAEKNIAVVVAALVDLARTGDAVAVLCGEGPERATAEAAVAAAGVRGRIHFAGYRADLWRILKTADVVVSLSHFEGSPNVVLEAAACGAPLVLSDIPAHRALLPADVADYVAPHDVDMIVYALRRILAEPGRAADRTRLAREVMRGRDPATCARTLLYAYESALNLRSLRRRARSAGCAAC